MNEHEIKEQSEQIQNDIITFMSGVDTPQTLTEELKEDITDQLCEMVVNVSANMLRKCKCNCKCSETKDKPKLHPGDCKIRVIVAQEEQCLPEFLEVQHEYHYQDGPEWLREKLQQHIEESGDRFIRPPQFVVLDIGEAMNKVQYLCSNDIVLDAKETSIEDA